MNEVAKFEKTDNILNDIQNIIEVSQKDAYHAVNTILSQRNWLIGYRIAEKELAGENRAEYGAKIIKKLSKELTQKYGKGFTKTNLYNFYRFYKYFFLRFSTQRVENWTCVYRGRIIELYYKYMMNGRVNGMRRKHMSRLGVCVLYREI